MSPKHSRICLYCRTRMQSDLRCDRVSRHPVVDLARRGDRAKLMDEVWGPPSLVRQAPALIRVGAIAVLAGALVAWLWGAHERFGTGKHLLLVLVAALLFGLGVALVGRFAAKAFRKNRHSQSGLRPYAALWREDRLPAGRLPKYIRGRVTLGEPMNTPILGTPCVGWGVTFRHQQAIGGTLTLQDGYTIGMQIELQDGRQVSIPAGRVLLEGDEKDCVHGTHHAPPPQAIQYLLDLDPESVSYIDEPCPPVPFTEIEERNVTIGDTVEVLDAFRSVAAAKSGQGIPETTKIRVPIGIARIRRSEHRD